MSEKTDHKAILLFVDDEENILRTLKRMFTPLGYTVLTAESGEKGIDLLEGNHVDLIISDMRMPGMNGAQFLSYAAKKWPDTKRLLLTGYADRESLDEAIEHGKVEFTLQKPWAENQLELAVEMALSVKRLEKHSQGPAH